MFRTRTRTVQEPETVTGRAWSPAQFVAAILGAAALVLGSWALYETGLNTDHIFSPHVTVWSLHHTPVLALAEIGFGALMLFSALSVYVGRALMLALGFCALGLGVVTVGDWYDGRLHQWLGVHDRNGWVFIIVGGMALTAGLLLPIRRATRTVVHERAVADEAPTAPVTAPAIAPAYADDRMAPVYDDERTTPVYAGRPRGRAYDDDPTNGRPRWQFWHRRSDHTAPARPQDVPEDERVSS